ncbi:flavin reductase family protein [Kangiella sediminilitoris]|uniref:Flavin reductase like domain-containing protein n=1 Tax=Kangiella sediminilitoris TaxID=1144748 RepID=A0A1B3B9X0_9GAMM|nr:flavin reductase family protein [Kangiella sediminilitoris]AOE49601.1 hypothetical protein KS2013_879 [Kangiella sediminilitoris]
MYLNSKNIEELERKYRLNLINSITGIKPANLIGTISADGVQNVAIFSSVVHLGSNPPLLGMIVRPDDDVPRNTFDNLRETGCYTINHIPKEVVKQAHYTSAKFPEDVSEFERCGLTSFFIDDFKAPFVEESPIKIGMEFKQDIPIELNGTHLVIGEIKMILAPDDAIDERGYIDLESFNHVGIAGLNQYYSFQKEAEFPYVRLNEVPEDL